MPHRSEPDTPGNLWRDRDFRHYAVAQGISVTGSGVTTIALSVLAVVDLHASTFNVALIAFASKLPPLLLSLHAGVLADRRRKRPLIITCDLLCAAVLLTLPIAQLLARITLIHLYAVAFTVAALQVIGSNASISYLPSLLGPGRIKDGNSKMGANNSLADLIGTNSGGVLVTVLGAARAVTVDAASYLASALLLWRIKNREDPPPARTAGTSHWVEIREGLTYTLHTPVVRSIVLSNTATSFVLAASSALWSVYLLRELHWSPSALGIVMGAGGIGGILGALVWQSLERCWGLGRVMLGALALNPLAQIPLVLADPGLGGQFAIGAGMVIQTGAAVCHGGLQRAVRQELAPDHLQGRAQATGAWLAFSLRPFAALAAGALGTLLGLRPTLTLITAALVVPFLVLWNSPVRALGPAAPISLTPTEEPVNP
ncbi:MFS transporter [Streptomyces sp. NBC_00258]|uniref:MFS transporter n=1 Tax=Streptomyces sp. NBC_00258 TaxID=2903642 RepID=UPI002E2E50D3|nr:MFS transporter [Streptomyces sp. NBC_00258]